MTHLKIVHLILKYWSHGSYISLFFVHYVTGIIRPAHRAPKIGKCNFIGIGWKKRENCTCIRAAGTYGDLGNGPQQILADIYIHPDSRRGPRGRFYPPHMLVPTKIYDIPVALLACVAFCYCVTICCCQSSIM